MKHWTKKSKLSIKLPTQHSTVQQGYGRWEGRKSRPTSWLLLSHIYKCSSTHFISLPFWIILSVYSLVYLPFWYYCFLLNCCVLNSWNAKKRWHDSCARCRRCGKAHCITSLDSPSITILSCCNDPLIFRLFQKGVDEQIIMHQIRSDAQELRWECKGTSQRLLPSMKTCIYSSTFQKLHSFTAH